eukprot:1415320-Pyramimonas_sp.AAC.1
MTARGRRTRIRGGRHRRRRRRRIRRRRRMRRITEKEEEGGGGRRMRGRRWRRRRSPLLPPPQVGITDVIAQQVTLAWADGRTKHQKDLLVLPRFVQDNKASTIHTAVEEGCRPFDIARISELCESVEWVMYADTPDNAKPNKRKQWFAASELPSN